MAWESSRISASPAPVVAGLAVATAARERLHWLDALKGIGIIAVVAGHLWTHGALRDAIYCFHMPLFFIASGAVVRPMPMRVLAPRLLRALGLPTLSFAILFLVLDFLVEDARHVRPIFPDAMSGVSAILTATERLRGPFAILWFAPCLLVARLVWNGLSRRFDPAGVGMFVVMAGVLLLALVDDAFGRHSPLGLLPVPAALLFIWIGALWKDHIPEPRLGLVCAVVAVAALLWMPPLNMRMGDLGWPVLGIVGAAAIVDRIAWIVRQMPEAVMAPLAWIGRNSLIIMFLHLGFLHYLGPYAAKSVLFVAGVAGPLLIGALLRRNRMAKLLFLGER